MRWFALLALLFAGPALAGVDINSATAEELETLPGIGASKAAAIVEYRTQNGPFTSVDQLDDVSGIGPSTLEALRSEVILGKPGTPSAEGGSGSTKSSKSEAAPKSEASSKAETTKSEGAASATPTAAASASCAVNINTADAAALDALPGIGASKAAAIVQSRMESGPFASCDDLARVSGIGASTLESLRSCCVVK
jgi:competence protein ComEA